MRRKFFLFILRFFQVLGEFVDDLSYWIVELCRRISEWAEDMAQKFD